MVSPPQSADVLLSAGFVRQTNAWLTAPTAVSAVQAVSKTRDAQVSRGFAGQTTAPCKDGQERRRSARRSVAPVSPGRSTAAASQRLTVRLGLDQFSTSTAARPVVPSYLVSSHFVLTSRAPWIAATFRRPSALHAAVMCAP